MPENYTGSLFLKSMSLTAKHLNPDLTIKEVMEGFERLTTFPQAYGVDKIPEHEINAAGVMIAAAFNSRFEQER